MVIPRKSEFHHVSQWNTGNYCRRFFTLAWKGYGYKVVVVMWYSKSWSVFKRKALEIQEHFLQHFADLVVDINVSAPRRGAFEIMVTNSRGVGMIYFCLWNMCIKCLLEHVFIYVFPSRNRIMEWSQARSTSSAQVPRSEFLDWIVEGSISLRGLCNCFIFSRLVYYSNVFFMLPAIVWNQFLDFRKW